MPEKLAPEEAIASVFADAIIAAGGIPLTMPITDDPALMETFVDMCDGVALPGGQDVNPRLWGDEGDYDPRMLCDKRDAFELELVRRVLAANKPLFATCRGMQLLNVALGGSLCMDVPNLEPRAGMALWRHEMILNDPVHPVEVEEETLLARSVGGARLIQVNSSHHCCVERLGEGVRLVGRATDGVPEAIEVSSQRFCLGVQWHPEYTWGKIETDFSLWRAFVDAATQTTHEGEDTPVEPAPVKLAR
jgi:putative glutamine amidotransferase